MVTDESLRLGLSSYHYVSYDSRTLQIPIDGLSAVSEASLALYLSS